MSLDETPYGMAAMGAFSLPGPKPSRPTAAPPAPVPSRAHLAGMDCLLDPSGVLYWPAERTLVVSDLHLETGSSYARNGQMLPPYDTGVTLARLAEAVARHDPARLVSLGDSFHDRGGAHRLSAADRATLAAIAAGREMVWIAGNHERDGAKALGGTVLHEFSLGGVTFRHIPAEGAPTAPEVGGHLHPAARLVVKGRTIKRRCFIGTAERLVMPAFGAYTRGLSVADPAFCALWGDARPQLHLMGRDRIHSL